MGPDLRCHMHWMDLQCIIPAFQLLCQLLDSAIHICYLQQAFMSAPTPIQHQQALVGNSDCTDDVLCTAQPTQATRALNKMWRK